MNGEGIGHTTWACVATHRTVMPTNCLLTAPSSMRDSGELLFGMYAHDSATGQRAGGIDTWQWPSDAASSAKGYLSLPGVFDMVPQRGHHRSINADAAADGDHPVLLVSCTDGTVKGVRCGASGSGSAGDEGGAAHNFEVSWSAVVDHEMVTSTTAMPGDAVKLVCSAHLGNLSVLMPSGNSGGPLEVMQQWQGHEFDAWCVAASSDDGDGTSCVWSGGDDGYLALWDLRTSCAPDAPVLRRRFDAGVVTIVTADCAAGSGGDNSTLSSCGLGAHQLLVGSYDEHLYVLDRRSMKRPVAQVHVGGGAWRCRPMPPSEAGPQHHTFAIAAMQGGAAIVEWTPSTSTLELTASMHTEDDVVVDSNGGGGGGDAQEGVLVYDCVAIDSRTVATCSFYNRAIKVWRRRDMKA